MASKNIMFIAPPAAGKGTQAELLSTKYNIPHISTGDLLRNASQDGTERGKMIADMMVQGILVGDEIILELLKERLQKEDCNNGYILDGYPRNIEQAKQYEEMLKELNKELGIVFYLDIDKEVAMKRIVGRVSCSNCGTVYNEMFEETKPLKDGVCDKCNSDLVKRADDNEETFNTRFETYINKTQALIDYYESTGSLYRINSGISKENTFEQIENILRGNI